MKTFLEYVARDILSKYGTNLSGVAVVFPNKRASLFLNDALARLAGKPMWSPAYITISDLFRSHSARRIADPVKLVCDLYRSYTEVTGFDETLDHFYGWGELLISDFDDIDKNMAPADKVFANLSDIHELDDVSYLNDEQKAIIRHFFSNFTDDHNTLLKERFLRLWSKMGDIYHDFNRRLEEQGLAYEGALYRQVADDASQAFQYDRYLFVGFNLLQVVEQRLFKRLKDEGKASFYWDFDHYYMKSEAGHFISQYLKDFPNELSVDDDGIYNSFRRHKDIHLISASTEDIQARYVDQWLQQGSRIEDGRHTAVVLCNEGLLQTVVHCLPDSVEHVNITTGYPLQLTPSAALVSLLFSLYIQGYDRQRERFRNRYIEHLHRHPYTQYIDETMLTAIAPDTSLIGHITAIFRHVARLAKDDAEQSPLIGESLFRTYTLLNRLHVLEQSGDLVVDDITMQRLTLQLVKQTTIPFHGEPAVGVQIMGVLETRNLDFDHVLLLSCNEGNIPRGITDASFIPYSIRRAYGLTTADHKVAIYAYYFHRLLSRATDVTIVYKNATTDGQTAEMSRFIQQLLVEDAHHTITRHTIMTGQHSQKQQPHAIEKTADVMGTLRQHFSQHILSPTAINRFMRCQLQFYYSYVEGLKEPDSSEEGIADNRAFGNIFHNAAQMLYEKLTQQSPRITAADLEALLKTRVDIERAVDAAFAQELKSETLSGLGIINREVIIHYLRQLVEIDRQLAPFTILELEKDVLQKAFVQSLGINVTIGGRVDRMDCINRGDGEQIRIIDYKTSASRLRPMKTVDDIFDDSQQQNHADYYLQTLLYARIERARQQTPVAPALLFIQHTSGDDYNPILKFGNDYINDVATPDGDRFVTLLMEKVNDIFDASQPFTPTADPARCRFCPYAQICGL